MASQLSTPTHWVGLGVSMWMQIAVSYTFPLYSEWLKSMLGIDQRQLALLGVAGDIGDNFGLLPTFVLNRSRPWVVTTIGAFACLFGYGFLWLILSGTVPSVPYWLLWVALCVATNSNAWFTSGVLVTNLRNFPESRGLVSGILKGYGGLGAAVYFGVYSVLLDSSSSKLLLFLALGVPTCFFMLRFFLRPCDPASGDDPKFYFIQACGLLLALSFLAGTILGDPLSLSAPIAYSLTLLKVLFLISPFAIPVKMIIYLPNPSTSALDSNLKEPLVTGATQTAPPTRGRNFTLSQALANADFWLLFMVYFVGVGSSVTVHNNLAQIGIALHMEDTKFLLSVFSFCIFVGRLGGGSISDYFLRLTTTPRTLFMAITQFIMMIMYILFAIGFHGTILVATCLLGVCYGFQFSIMVATASELFGLPNFSMIFNVISVGNPLGAYLFSSLLAGYLYEAEAGKQESKTCLGPCCFRLTFGVLAGVCAVGVVLSVILTERIRPVYISLYAGQPDSSTHGEDLDGMRAAGPLVSELGGGSSS